MRRALAITGLATSALILLAPGNSNADDRLDVAGKYTVQGKPKRTVTITKHGDTFHLECFDPDCGAFGRVSGVGIMHNGLLAVSYPANVPGPYYFGNHGPGGPGGPGAWSPASVVIVYKISKDKLEGRIGMLGANFKDGIVRNETLVHEKDPAKPDAARAAFDYKVLTIPDVPGPFQNDKARKQLNDEFAWQGRMGARWHDNGKFVQAVVGRRYYFHLLPTAKPGRPPALGICNTCRSDRIQVGC